MEGMGIGGELRPKAPEVVAIETFASGSSSFAFDMTQREKQVGDTSTSRPLSLSRRDSSPPIPLASKQFSIYPPAPLNPLNQLAAEAAEAKRQVEAVKTEANALRRQSMSGRYSESGMSGRYSESGQGVARSQ